MTNFHKLFIVAALGINITTHTEKPIDINLNPEVPRDVAQVYSKFFKQCYEKKLNTNECGKHVAQCLATDKSKDVVNAVEWLRQRFSPTKDTPAAAEQAE